MRTKSFTRSLYAFRKMRISSFYCAKKYFYHQFIKRFEKIVICEFEGKIAKNRPKRMKNSSCLGFAKYHKARGEKYICTIDRALVVPKTERTVVMEPRKYFGRRISENIARSIKRIAELVQSHSICDLLDRQ